MPTVTVFGGIEAGGTKWVCGIGSSPDRVETRTSFPTTTPAETIGRAVAFFRDAGPVAAIGIGCFGPIDLHPTSPRFGHITTTPKAGWVDTDVVTPLAEATGVPVGFDTDVTAAALGEWRHGAARGLATFCYLTVGTGIGGGLFVGGRRVHGLRHPELGHMRVPHDRELDPFDGVCPYHGDCLEGLASGEAMRARWGAPAEQLGDPRPWELEASYLALGLVNVVAAVSPERIVVGGGVTRDARLLPLVRARFARLAGGYFGLAEGGLATDGFIVPPGLGEDAGLVGALELAREAVRGPDRDAVPLSPAPAAE